MRPEDLDALTADVKRAVENSAIRIKEAREQEFVGMAADDLVTARLLGGRLDIDIHVLAKRRMERDDLGAAIVEAVNDAERQAAEAFQPDTDFESRLFSMISPKARERYHEVLQQLRSRMP